MQLSRTNITTSGYKSERLDSLHARTPAITISRFSTISLAFLPGESVFTNWQQILDTANDEQDGELAKQLAGLELSERFNSSLLSLWKNRLRGKKSIAALVALADESAFLDPPAAEILSDPAPDLETQRQMMSRTVKYLKEAIPKLPDFFAIRTTTEYEQPSPQKADTWKTAPAYQSLREAVTEKATLRYRNGHEEQDAEKKKGSPSARKRDLNFIGVFSPILGSVLVDATRGDSILTLEPLGTGRTRKGGSLSLHRSRREPSLRR